MSFGLLGFHQGAPQIFALAVTADTTNPGFNIRWSQVASGQENTINRAEQQLAGLRSDNQFDDGKA